jgi:membrane protein
VATQAASERRLPRLRHFAARSVRGIDHYLSDYGPQYAAAISYKAIFAVIPLLTFAITVVGAVLQDDTRRQQVIDEITDALPLSEEAGADIDRLISQIPSPWSLLGIASLLVVLWSASGVMGSLRVALSVASEAPTASYARNKLTDIVLVLVVTVLLVVASVVNIVHGTLSQWTDEISGELRMSWLAPVVDSVVSGFLLPAVLLVGASAFIFWFVPPVRVPWRYLAVAAVLAGVALQVIQLALAWWLSWTASSNFAAGVIGAVLGFLFTVYISANAFLVVGELMYAWAGRDTPPRHGKPSMIRRVALRLEGIDEHRS